MKISAFGKAAKLGALSIMLGLPTLCRALPSAESFGKLLGYPASEMIVEDTTDAARALMRIPTLAERRDGAPMPGDDNRLVSFTVKGRSPLTFFPIQIDKAKRGTFLTPELRETLQKIDSLPGGAIDSGGRGPCGSIFQGKGEGGLYFGEIKVKSKVNPGNTAVKAAALISVFLPDGRDDEIRVAFLLSLGAGNDLAALPGGEEYFEIFRPEDSGSPARHERIRELFWGLNQLVVQDGIPAANSPPQPPTPQKSLPQAPAPPDPTTHTTASQKLVENKSWGGKILLWLLGGLCLVLAIRKILGNWPRSRGPK